LGAETVQLIFLLKNLSNFFFWLAEIVTIKNSSIWHSKALKLTLEHSKALKLTLERFNRAGMSNFRALK